METNNLETTKQQLTFDDLYQLRVNSLFDKFTSDSIKDLLNKSFEVAKDPRSPKLTVFEKDSLFILLLELKKLMPLLEATSY